MDLPLIDLQPIWLSLQLAGVTVLILLVWATPLAWWLAHTRSRFRVVVEAVVALPLVLPPTVLGFYMLILLGPHGWVGGPVQALTGSALSFSFAGLVFASCIYSLPFVVQPLHSAFESVGKVPMETAQSLGASRLDAFFFGHQSSGSPGLPDCDRTGLCSHPGGIWRGTDGRWQYSGKDQSDFH